MEATGSKTFQSCTSSYDDQTPMCRTRDFRSDTNELCSQCGLASFIYEGIKKQSLFQARQQQELLDRVQFEEYIKGQIKISTEAMMEMNLNVLRGESESNYIVRMPTTVKLFLWNKEIIKTLRNLLEEPNKSSEKAKPMYTSFANLFKKLDDIRPSIEVLDSYEKSQNRAGKYKKFVIVAWIDYLESIGKIHTNKYELVAPVLVTEFAGWSIARRTWYDHAEGYDEAKKYFTMNIPQ